MGKGSSKNLNLQHLQGQQVTGRAKNVDESKQENSSWKINKRNTYYLIPGQNTPKAADERDPPKTGEGGSTPPKTIEDESMFKEDSEGDPPYDTVDVEDSSTSARSHDGGRFQDPQGQINKNTEDGTEYRFSTPYVNMKFLREQGHIAESKKSGRPECEAALSIRRHYRELKRRVWLESVCDHFIQGGVLLDIDLENIMRGFYPQQARVDILLQIMLRKKSQKVFKAFYLALQNTGCQDLAAKLENTEEVVPEKPYMRDWSSNDILNAWPGIEELLIDELQPEYILDFFMQEDIFSVDEYEGVFWYMGRRVEMTKTLLETMKKNLPQALFVLLYALKEVDEENKSMVEELERLVAAGKYLQEASENCHLHRDNIKRVSELTHDIVILRKERRIYMNKLNGEKLHTRQECAPLSVDTGRVHIPFEVYPSGSVYESGEKQSNTDVHLVTVYETTFSPTVPLSTNPVRTVRLSVEKEGNVVEKVEIEIDKYMNTDTACLLQIFLPPTGCEITQSERGCVTVHLRPHSKHAFDKLSKFCKNGGLENFVLNLLREKDIFSSLPSGELCVNIQVQYHVGELEAEDAEELETDLIKSIKDNWSFLCEELDVNNLISASIKKTIFTDQETTELEGRAAKDRHEAADYFLTCLLNKGPTGIQLLMDALKEKNNMKIINRLQKLDPLYQNPQAVKENLTVHFESIVQEIDPSQFKDTFVDRKILDRKFFTDLREKHLKRRCRAALFLREVLNKGNRAIYALLDVMTELGCDELLAKLVSLEDNQLLLKQQKQDDRKEDIVMVVSNEPSPEDFIWSCSLKLNVEKKEKDEKKQQIAGSSSEKEEPLYMNLNCYDRDEGIGGAEDESFVTLRSKEGIGQTSRPVTHPESSLSYYSESDSDKCLTYPRTRESEEAKKTIISRITSAAMRSNGDSGIDVSVST